jgi:NADH-quinone oxidoreductase subunit G
MGATLAGCIPRSGSAADQAATAGMNAAQMLESPRRGYVIYGLDAELDCLQGARMDDALARADFVVSLSVFKSETMNRADVVLPIAPFTESAGTWINLDGCVQRSYAAVKPKGEARPGWKVLRVLGNHLDADGFDYVDIEGVRSEMALKTRYDAPEFDANPNIAAPGEEDRRASGDDFHRILDVPLYRIDPYVRRAAALQATRDNMKKPIAGLNPVQFERFSLREGTIMNVVAPDGVGVSIEVRSDHRVPENCIYIPGGYRQTAPLGIARRVALEEV